MSDAADSEQLEKLGAAINELSKAAATQALTYLLLWLYLLFTVTGVTDYDLLVQNPIKLPIFNLEIGLLKFFIGAPALFWLVQLYMSRKVMLIADAMRRFLTLARTSGQSLETLRHRVDGFVITRLVARFEAVTLPDGRTGPAMPPLPRALTVLAAGVSLVLAPMLLYLAFQTRFLAYQEEWITWWHRGFVFIGLVLSATSAREAGLTWRDALTALVDAVGALFGRVVRDRVTPFRDWLAGAVGWTVGPLIVAASLFVLTFPGETMSEGIEVEGILEVHIVKPPFDVHNTLSPKPQPGAPVVAFKDGVDAEAGTPPLDLRHRDFSYRNLRGINLAGADMTGIKLVEAVMDGAILWRTTLNRSKLWNLEINGAELSSARMENSDMRGARLNGAHLIQTNFSGSDMRGVELNGSDMNQSNLNGTTLVNSYLNGANLTESSINGSDLKGSYLNSANLYRAKINGSDLSSASLIGANLIKSDISGSRLYLTQTEFSEFIELRHKYTAYLKPVHVSGALGNVMFNNTLIRIKNWLSSIPRGRYRDEAEARLLPLKRITWSDIAINSDYTLEEQINSDNTSLSIRIDRTIYILRLICNHSEMPRIIEIAISRSSSDPYDLSASMLSERFNDTANCPAAKYLTDDQRRRLVENVEAEKRWKEERAKEKAEEPTLLPSPLAPALPSHAVAFQ